MSILQKVLRAVKKMFKAATVKRRPAKKRHLRIQTSVVRPRKPPKQAAQRPSVRKAKPRPSVKKKASLSKKPVIAAKKAIPKVKTQVKPAGLLVGEVTHYFDRIKVCVIRINRDHIKKGDRILIQGVKSELTQKVTSMQIENEDVTMGKKGQMIGLKVAKPVFVKDGVYKI